jgi:hypothetical protein
MKGPSRTGDVARCLSDNSEDFRLGLQHSSGQDLDDLVEGVVGFAIGSFDSARGAAVRVGRRLKRGLLSCRSVTRAAKASRGFSRF